MPNLHRIALISAVKFGGATTFICNLAGELVRRNVPVMVVSPEKENAFASDFQAAGVKVVLHDDRRMIFEDRMDAMLKTLAEFRPTVVIGCLGESSYEILRYVPKNVYRMAVIQADHKIFYDAAIPYAGFMDAIVGVSTRIAERLEQMDAFCKVSKLCLLHGVSMPQVAEPRGRAGQPLRILYLGRIMDPQKRIYLFPKILTGLKKEGIPFQWIIAGEGDKRNELEQAMPSSSSQQVMFIGTVPNAQVPALLERHDIFLLASDAEGLPISLLEAMAHGVVPVVSDLASGIRDVVDAANGMLVPVNNVEGYARAIIHLHEHREELAAKSAAARARVQNEFTVEAMTDRWLAAFPTAASPAAVAWPTNWDIKPPLRARHPIYFSPPMRVLRRLAAKLRR
ncbi:MAG: glycosyltransferase family 4 protein [Verrucomicrobiota bacterium]|jgi:glycosyltransferase involved in cell wall biosynthesis